MNIQVGDIITRRIGQFPDSVDMDLKVTELTPEQIICGPWMFSRLTGGEIDEDLGWDGITKAGSVIVGVKRHVEQDRTL